MPTLELEFEAFCGRCGAGLCNNTSESRSKSRRMPAINVDPCSTCLEKEADAATNKAYDQGYSEGLKDGEARHD